MKVIKNYTSDGNLILPFIGGGTWKDRGFTIVHLV